MIRVIARCAIASATGRSRVTSNWWVTLSKTSHFGTRYSALARLSADHKRVIGAVLVAFWWNRPTDWVEITQSGTLVRS